MHFDKLIVNRLNCLIWVEPFMTRSKLDWIHPFNRSRNNQLHLSWGWSMSLGRKRYLVKSVRLCHFPLMSHTISQLLYFLIASCVFLVASFGLSLFDGHLQIFIWASWIEPRDDFCPHHFPPTIYTYLNYNFLNCNFFVDECWTWVSVMHVWERERTL